jgi:protein subunit release factor B
LSSNVRTIARSTAPRRGDVLKSRLYEHELRKRQEEQQSSRLSRHRLGHQIRSYDQSRIKDCAPTTKWAIPSACSMAISISSRQA